VLSGFPPAFLFQVWSAVHVLLVSHTSRVDGCGFYSALILVESKMLKQVHSTSYATVSAMPLSAKIGRQKTATVAV